MPSIRPSLPWTTAELERRVREAVQSYWNARGGQATRQRTAGVTDTGARGEVTGGQHLNAFCTLFCDVVRAAGFRDAEIRYRTGVELPGYFRPTKKWDIVVARNGRLCAAIEMKSQVGPSFGNNFNNRTEEAVGSSVDFWTAYREGVMGTHQPWLGYFFFLEEAPRSTAPVGVARSVFEPDPVWRNTSYAQRYDILCRRLVLERHYNAAALVLAPRRLDGSYGEPNSDLSVEHFVKALYAQLIASA